LPACADRLHPGFFRGKPPGVAFKLVSLALDIRNLARSINSLRKPLPIALNRLPNTTHLRQIDSSPENQSSAPDVVMVRRPCFTPLVLINASANFRTAPALPRTTSTSRQLS